MTTYRWNTQPNNNNTPVTASWDNSGTWTPMGIPGSEDTVVIGSPGPGSASTQTLTGPGAAAGMVTYGSTTLQGNFTIDNVTVTVAGFPDSLGLHVTGTLTVESGTLTVAGALTSGLGLVAQNGGIITVAQLVVDEANSGLSADASSSIAIGTGAQVQPGEISIAPGVVLSLPEFFDPTSNGGSVTISAPSIVNNGAISLLGTAGESNVLIIGCSNLVNDGTISDTNGELTLFSSGGVNGNGKINVGANSTFFAGYFGPQTGNTIHFIGTGNNFILNTQSLDASQTFDPLIFGFNASDVIDFSGAPVTAATITTPSPTESVLNLLDGTQVVARIDLSGNYTGVTFAATPTTPSGTTQINIVSSGPASFGDAWNLVGVRDFNGDGDSDLAWQRQSDNLVEIHLLNENSTIGGGTIQKTPFNSSWSVAATDDFNGDGLGDLVYRRVSDGLTEIQFLSGFSAIGGGAIANNPFDASWNIVATGDFNGDGKSDLVWQRASDGLVEIQLLNGITPVGGGVIANNPFGAGWNVVATGDFNGDGKADLVWQNPSLGGLVEIQFLHGNTAIGGGTIAGSPFGPGWNIVGAGDFLGNGHTDLVYQRQSDDLVEIQYLNGSTAVGGGALTNSPFGPGWAVIGVGDFNHDGKADLVYRNAASGVTEVQFLNGTTPIGGGIVAFG